MLYNEPCASCIVLWGFRIVTLSFAFAIRGIQYLVASLGAVCRSVCGRHPSLNVSSENEVWEKDVYFGRVDLRRGFHRIK